MEERLLRKSKILQAVHRLAQKRGQEVYLVGGAIRDLLLRKRLGKDFDFVGPGDLSGLAHGLAQEFKCHAFPLDETFGTWRVVIKRPPRKAEVDFSTMQGRDMGEDLRQRDFTLNSMAIGLKEIFPPGTPTLIDPLGGLSDLRQRILRANSEESLRQDPLRMLRAFRLATTLGLKIDQETGKMVQRNKKLLLHSAWERIRSEFFTGLREIRAYRFLRNLHEAGLLQEIFPEIEGWEELDQGNHHDFLLLEHSFKTVEAGELIFSHFQDLFPTYALSLENHFSRVIEEGVSRGALFKFVAFFHDSGKVDSRSLEGETKSIRFLDHDQLGEKINATIARRMKLSRKSMRIISTVTRQHMRILSLSKAKKVTPRAEYRFFRDLGKEGIDVAFLALADGLAARENHLHWPLAQELPADLERIREVSGELTRYYYEEFSQKPQKPLLDGREIMEAFGLSPGEAVGSLLARLREAEMAGQVRTREEALRYLKSIDRSNPLG